MLLNPVFSAPAMFRPAVNTRETEQAFIVELARPGWSKEDIELKVDGEILIVKGQSVHQKDEQVDKSYRRREFGKNSFSRSFHLPEIVNVDAISATMDNGVLSIEMPKLEEALPVKRAIAIN